MDPGFHALEKFIGGLDPKHQYLIPPLGLLDQGGALDVADRRTVEKGVVKRLKREVQEHIVF